MILPSLYLADTGASTIDATAAANVKITNPIDIIIIIAYVIGIVLIGCFAAKLGKKGKHSGSDSAAQD